MNRVRIGLLIAAAAIVGLPELAVAQDNPGWRQQRGDRGGERGERGAPSPVQDRRAMASPAPPAAAPGQLERQAGGPRGDGAWRTRAGDPAGRRDVAPPPQQQGAPGGFAGDANRGRGDDWRQGRSDNDRREWRGDDGRRDARRPDVTYGNGGRNGDGQAWRGNRDDRARGRGDFNRSGWRNDWRTDRRYDWHGWRNQNRGLFRAPRYVPPRNYGWGYRTFSIGFRLNPYLYAPSYWLNDPWEYRLPPAYGPYRWVRYYNDVLLVDIQTGQVVDAINGFFF